MRTSILFFFLSAFIFNGLIAQDKPKPTQPIESLFDFWIGEWEVSWDEADGKKGSGTNIITSILDGKAIQEDFTGMVGNYVGFKGRSISGFNTIEKKWYQMWTDNQGGHYNFVGAADGDKRIFKTEKAIAYQGKEYLFRMTFYNISKEKLTWDWENSTDGGTTWNLNWRIFYKRKVD